MCISIASIYVLVHFFHLLFWLFWFFERLNNLRPNSNVWNVSVCVFVCFATHSNLRFGWCVCGEVSENFGHPEGIDQVGNNDLKKRAHTHTHTHTKIEKIKENKRVINKRFPRKVALCSEIPMEMYARMETVWDVT